VIVQPLETPIGVIHLAVDDDQLVELQLPNHPAPTGDFGKHPILTKAATQLREYFAGKRTEFDLPLAPRGTEFQQRVWKQLLAVGYGETCSYGDIATAIQSPTASRAVGAANGKNPIAIIIPCHRVIGANGSLTGYGGGVPTKRWLLDHERERVQPRLPESTLRAWTG
jgi:methylated-DNA-[protein]-cysteine S-methyltransferase